MDELHAAIADYLRGHNPRLLAPCPPVVAPAALARCRSCGGPITATADIRALGPLLAVRKCLSCYLATEAA